MNNSRSQRVLWLLEELGVSYEVKRYERDPKTMLAPAALLAVHPLGKSPVITDDAATAGGTAVTVAESGAIVEYLVERHGQGRLAPVPGSADFLAYRYWLHYAEGSAMPPLLLKLIFDRLGTTPLPWPLGLMARRIASSVKDGFIAPQLKRHLDFMEAELGRRTWFAGEEFTAADVQMSFPLEAAQSRAGLDAGRPKLVEFLTRIHARPAYQRALERGGPYAYSSPQVGSGQ